MLQLTFDGMSLGAEIALFSVVLTECRTLYHPTQSEPAGVDIAMPPPTAWPRPPKEKLWFAIEVLRAEHQRVPFISYDLRTNYL
jgi:hypothetical protein